MINKLCEQQGRADTRGGKDMTSNNANIAPSQMQNPRPHHSSDCLTRTGFQAKAAPPAHYCPGGLMNRVRHMGDFLRDHDHAIDSTRTRRALPALRSTTGLRTWLA